MLEMPAWLATSVVQALRWCPWLWGWALPWGPGDWEGPSGLWGLWRGWSQGRQRGQTDRDRHTEETRKLQSHPGPGLDGALGSPRAAFGATVLRGAQRRPLQKPMLPCPKVPLLPVRWRTLASCHREACRKQDKVEHGGSAVGQALGGT